MVRDITMQDALRVLCQPVREDEATGGKWWKKSTPVESGKETVQCPGVHFLPQRALLVASFGRGEATGS